MMAAKMYDPNKIALMEAELTQTRVEALAGMIQEQVEGLLLMDESIALRVALKVAENLCKKHPLSIEILQGFAIDGITLKVNMPGGEL